MPADVDADAGVVVQAPAAPPTARASAPSGVPGDATPTSPEGVTQPKARRYSLRTSLLSLLLLCVLPAALLSASLAVANHALQRERVYRDTLLLADHLTALLDRELAATASGMAVLASAPELQNGDLAAFHARARAALPAQVVNNYLLTDRAGVQRLNTLVPWGQPLPQRGTPPQLDRVFTERRLVVTDLFIGPVTSRPVIAMGVPVQRGDEVVYSLNIGLAPDRIAGIVSRAELPPGWIAAVLDGSGTIVARTRDADRFVGQKAVPMLQENLRRRTVRSFESETKEGIPVVTALAHSAVSSWAVAVGAPRSLLEAQLAELVAWASISLAVTLALGLWLAWRLAGRVTTAVRGLNDAALALGRGEPVVLPRTQLIEADAVGAAIVQASDILGRAQHLAHHDALTGLTNRLLFDEMLTHHLADRMRRGGALAVLAIDLDGFKGVNDRLGHAAGDRVLRTVGARLLATLRAADVAARLGGDEFAVLLAPTDASQAMHTAQRLLAALSAPYEGVGAGISASIGVAICPPEASAPGAIDSTDLREAGAALLARADRALYEAKRHGKARVVLAD